MSVTSSPSVSIQLIAAVWFKDSSSESSVTGHQSTCGLNTSRFRPLRHTLCLEGQHQRWRPQRSTACPATRDCRVVQLTHKTRPCRYGHSCASACWDYFIPQSRASANQRLLMTEKADLPDGRRSEEVQEFFAGVVDHDSVSGEEWDKLMG